MNNFFYEEFCSRGHAPLWWSFTINARKCLKLKTFIGLCMVCRGQSPCVLLLAVPVAAALDAMRSSCYQRHLGHSGRRFIAATHMLTQLHSAVPQLCR